MKQNNDSTTPRLCKHYQTAPTQSTKVQETQYTNPKTKNRKCNDKSILNKFKLKSTSGPKQRCIQTPEASKKTQQSSKLTQQHLIFPKKEKIREYATVCRKPAYIRGYPSKNRMYMRL